MTEQLQAQKLLEQKDKSMDGVWKGIFRSKLLWAFLVGILYLLYWAVANDADSGMVSVLCFLGGLLLGRIVRDIVWLRRMAAGWPFTRKVINWDAVKDIAHSRIDTDNE